MCGYFWRWGNFCEKSNFSSLWRVFCSILCFFILKSCFCKFYKVTISKRKSSSIKKSDHFDFACYSCQSSCLFRYGFLIGSAALNFSFDEKILFALGALSASFLWFFSLGYGAKFLSSYIKPNIVKIIDLLACLIMCMVAYSLILYILERI